MRALVLLALLAGCTSTEPESTGRYLHPDRLRTDLAQLADDEHFAGRGTGEAGGAFAADWLAESFEEAELSTLPGQDDWKIPYTLHRRGYDSADTRLVIAGEGAPETRLGHEFRPFPFSDEGEVEAELVFAGYGIHAPGLGWDDYADLDVTGKVVVVLRHDPGEVTSATGEKEFSLEELEALKVWKENSGHALFASKARVAAERGAVGMLLITDPLNHEEADDLRATGRLRLDPPEEDRPGRRPVRDPEAPQFLALHVARSTGEALVESTGKDLAALQTALNAGDKVNGPLTRTAKLAVKRMAEPQPLEVHNVVGFLEGSDPVLKDEWVVVGAHFDHLGTFDGHGDTVYNGADDNASGTAGMLALARAFAALPPELAPKRSLVFAGFSGEEKGLLGSRALVEGGTLSDQVVFMLNLDMIGRSDNGVVEVTGDAYATGLAAVVEAANTELALPVELGGLDYTGNSDHHPFYEADIPFLFLHTGLHEDYHQLSDHLDKLDVDQMARIVRLGMEIVRPIAAGDVSPRFVHHVTWLGITVQLEDGEAGSRAVVTAVEPGSRGEEAGLQTGDAIHGFGEVTLMDPSRVGEQFRAIEPGATAKIAIDRANSRLTFDVERAKTGYLGVWPAPLTPEFRAEHGLREDEGLLLRQVMEGTPAAEAGLKDGDALIAVHGVPVGLGSLSRVLTRIGAGETVPVTVIRDGARTDLTITLGERPERP